MIQIVYISTAKVGADALPQILAVSRTNNARDAITGLLYAGGGRFLQVLEGPSLKVDLAIARIAKDPRHRAVVTLSRREIAEREFGAWSMAVSDAGELADNFVARVSALVANAAPSVRATFESLAAMKHAA